MVALVLICHETQRQNLERILPACAQQAADHKVLVFEYVNNTVPAGLQGIACSYGFEVVFQHHEPSGFYAGRNRDAGIRYVLDKYGPCDFVFVDGDCIPSPNLIEHHSEVLAYHTPMITCGYRVNLKDPPQGDRRFTGPMVGTRLFVAHNDRLIMNINDIKSHNVCWSCNLGINYAAVLRIQEANKTLAPESKTPRVFSEVFDGQWGGEDTLCGVAAFRTSCGIAMLDPLRSCVNHIEHPTKHQHLSNLKRCHAYELEMSSKLPKTSILAGRSLDTFRPDTLEFYNNISEVTKHDPWADLMLRHCECSEAQAYLVHYMFSRNPTYRSNMKSPLSMFKQAEVLELYERMRHTVISTHKIPDDFVC